MIGLAFASLVTWTIWFAKGVELAAARRRARSCVRKLTRADNLEVARAEIEDGWTAKGTVAELMETADRELKRSPDLSAEGVARSHSLFQSGSHDDDVSQSHATTFDFPYCRPHGRYGDRDLCNSNRRLRAPRRRLCSSRQRRP